MRAFLTHARASLANWIGGSGWSPLAGGVSGRLKLPGVNRPAENLPTVYACLRARIAAIQQASLRVGSGDNLVTGGDLFDLLARPARDLDAAHWLGVLEGYLTLYDMVFVAKVGEPGRPPDELVPLSPRYMQPVMGVHAPTGTAVALAWIYLDPYTGSQLRFSPDDLIVIQGFNPHVPLRALAPTDAALRTMQGDLAARESNLAIFLNGGSPSMVLETDQRVTKEQADEMLQRFSDKYSGFGNAHKPALLYNGLKAAKTGLTPQELQFLEGLRFSTQELLMTFRVMPAMLGVMTGETGLSQGTSTQEQKLAWWEDVGLPELARIASALQHSLIAKYNWKVTTRAATRGETCARQQSSSARATLQSSAATKSLVVYFDENQIPALAKHRLAKLEQFTKLLPSGYEPDGLNEYLDLGLPPHPTNVGMIPMSMMPVTELAAKPETGNLKPESGTKAHETDETRELDAIFGRLEAALTEDGDRLAKKYENARKQFQALVAQHTKVGARKISGFFVEQRGRVQERLKVARAMHRENADDLLAAIFPKDEENTALVRQMLGAWTSASQDGWNLTNTAVGASENPFTVDDPRIKSAIEARKIQGAKMNDTTAEDLRKVLRDGVDAGLNTTELGDKIAEYYAAQIGEKSVRPLTAARTQMAGIVNDGQMASARAVGGLKKIWIHGAPAESRPAHVDAQTRYAEGIGLDEKFVVNGVSMDAPGDAGADVGETANCTCMVGFKK